MAPLACPEGVSFPGKVSSVAKSALKASERANRNKKTCQELAGNVRRIGDLMQSLQQQQPGIGIMEHPEMRTPLMELNETLQRAHDIVEDCSRGGCLRGLWAGGSRETRLNDVQSKITSFLLLFHIISYLDSTRLLNATNRFSIENLTENGPLFSLYKGRLDGKDVTIKKVSVFASVSGQQLPPSVSESELFKNEVRIVWELQHKNIVNLVGFCMERDNRILVYEYMQNGSLEDAILGIAFIAPEYMKEGIFSVKTDVYSFGTIVLEIISGQRWVIKLLFPGARKRRLSQQREMRRCVRVALLCIQEKPERRPDMVEVIRMLLSPKKAKTPFPRRPGYANARESSMYAGDRSTTNP
ncbi:hypothetical protein HU200_015621 [Digitaria exilis]|uniref:Protein kinase domain-containing protein n=1 Tax=Digitaria exilis TaxID=1010633 RepID=A0A835F8W4_9POAL|nr:hypothetical protein HU200_015621 [Digitaria exilis]